MDVVSLAALLLSWETLAWADPAVAAPQRTAPAVAAAGATSGATPDDHAPAFPDNAGGRPAGSSTLAASPFIAVQAGPPPVLPSLVLPPAFSTEPPLLTSLMRMGDVAMVRGDVARARALYERAAEIQPVSSAALIAAGKTYDPNMLTLLNMNSAGLADAARARDWYERARSLGDPAAAPLLAGLR
jgi:hypothetical protein